MQNTNKSHKINPEIRTKAEQLFTLIEAEIDKRDGDEDSFCEDMAEQYGDFLRGSEGYKNLEFSHKLTVPYSQQAIFSMEETTWHMNDKALGQLSRLAKNAKEVVEIIKEGEHSPIMRLKELSRIAPKVYDLAFTEWQVRAKRYRREFE